MQGCFARFRANCDLVYIHVSTASKFLSATGLRFDAVDPARKPYAAKSGSVLTVIRTYVHDMIDGKQSEQSPDLTERLRRSGTMDFDEA